MSEKETVQVYYSIKQLLEVESDNFEKSELKELEKKYAASINQLKKFRLAEFTVSKTKMLCDVFEKITKEMQATSKGKITLTQGIENEYGLILKITQDVEEILLPDVNHVEISKYVRNKNGMDTSEIIKVLRTQLKNLKIDPPPNFIRLIETKEKILFALLKSIANSSQNVSGEENHPLNG